MDINKFFVRKCVNQYRVREKFDKLILYRREDLYKWACEADARGEDYFYCRPVDPDDIYGKYELCEPEYRWFLNCDGLTDDEFKSIGGEI
jgi:hypothetical protein